MESLCVELRGMIGTVCSRSTKSTQSAPRVQARNNGLAVAQAPHSPVIALANPRAVLQLLGGQYTMMIGIESVL
jgi:hypothetical protein